MGVRIQRLDRSRRRHLDGVLNKRDLGLSEPVGERRLDGVLLKRDRGLSENAPGERGARLECSKRLDEQDALHVRVF